MPITIKSMHTTAIIVLLLFIKRKISFVLFPLKVLVLLFVFSGLELLESFMFGFISSLSISLSEKEELEGLFSLSFL